MESIEVMDLVKQIGIAYIVWPHIYMLFKGLCAALKPTAHRAKAAIFALSLNRVPLLPVLGASRLSVLNRFPLRHFLSVLPDGSRFSDKFGHENCIILRNSRKC